MPAVAAAFSPTDRLQRLRYLHILPGKYRPQIEQDASFLHPRDNRRVIHSQTLREFIRA
jgi:hypothetical protein